MRRPTRTNENLAVYYTIRERESNRYAIRSTFPQAIRYARKRLKANWVIKRCTLIPFLPPDHVIIAESK